MVDRRRERGISGEDQAAAWYRANGYEVVARNWRCRDGELDLVVRRDGELVFVEVKWRSSSRFGMPAEAVTAAKQRRLRRLATRFLAESRERSSSLRFDVVAILGDQLEVIEAAF